MQQIIDEFQQVHNVGNKYFAHQLTTLQGLSVNEQQIKDVVAESMKDDLWKMCGPLRSDHTRKTFHKSNFRYVNPVEICLGR